MESFLPQTIKFVSVESLARGQIRKGALGTGEETLMALESGRQMLSDPAQDHRTLEY